METLYAGNQMPLIIYAPNNTVKLNITATTIDKDNSLMDYSSTMSLPEIMEARIAGEEWEDDNVRYVLTDKGRAALEGDTNGD